jgi:hypothetical protein
MAMGSAISLNVTGLSLKVASLGLGGGGENHEKRREEEKENILVSQV